MILELVVKCAPDRFVSDFKQQVDIDIFEHVPDGVGISVTPGGIIITVDEARQVIAAMQQAIDTIEGKVK